MGKIDSTPRSDDSQRFVNNAYALQTLACATICPLIFQKADPWGGAAQRSKQSELDDSLQVVVFQIIINTILSLTQIIKKTHCGIGDDGSQTSRDDSRSEAIAQAAAQQIDFSLDETKTLQFGQGSLRNRTLNPNTMMSGMTSTMSEQPERELTWKHIKLQLKVDFWPPYLPVAGRVGNATDSASKLQTVNIEKDTWKTIIDYLET
ncbi:MAG: hypothetical protein EZS28_019569 [Streblomastix strix]|uniref:Uncharacterized protein n=1 Tax=Streblomastix strix TaxID=222440 RepID=A0A5J4VRU2_9EUKA|nr:MAG: hypothetical protein EZS28_019569 [Streblomastix strix]